MGKRSSPCEDNSASHKVARSTSSKRVNVVVEGGEGQPKITTFSDLHEFMPEWLVTSLCSSFSQPTPIQMHAWGAILTSHDVIAIAQTGSGKTLAFGLPALAFCLSLKKIEAKKPRVLVLAPTRELAMQTARVVELAHETSKNVEDRRKIGVACILGGVEKHSQRTSLRTGAIVVATPGRLQDMVGEGAVELGRVNMFVLDEADRMLDMGFERDVRNIASMVHQDGKRAGRVQTLMFSATWPIAIRRLASDFLRSGKDLVRISVGGSSAGSAEQDEALNAADQNGGGEGTAENGGGGHYDHSGPVASHSITQHVLVIEPFEKDQTLEKLLRQHHSKGERVIVFCLYKKEAARVETMLNRKGWSCVALHGDMSQAARTHAFNSFRDNKVDMLVATDVAARGVDLPNVEHVINYTFPLTIEDYVHRIGRTGRGDATGDSHTFFTKEDKAHAGSLVNVLRGANQEVPQSMMQFSLTTKKKLDPTYGAFGPKADLIGKTATKITFGDDDD